MAADRQGAIWLTDVAVETSPAGDGAGRIPDAPFRCLAEVWEEQASLEPCAEILRIDDQVVREHLIGQLRLMEAVQLRRRKRSRVRRRTP